MNEDQIERVLDARVMRRLATDRTYLNAENADEQKAREEDIESEEYEKLQRETA